MSRWRALTRRYLAAGRSGRRALLASTVDTMALPSQSAITRWTRPRAIDSLEWFASADDICRVYASLSGLARRPGLSPIANALELNDGGLGLDPARWKSTWFKAGDEPGVLTLSYLATTRSGRSYAAIVLTENPSAPINQASAVPVLLSAVKSAFKLAAGN